MTTLTDLKRIGYDQLTKDFMASYDGNVIGYFPSYHAAELALNDHVLGLCEQGLIDQPLIALEPTPLPEPDDIPGADPAPGRALAAGRAIFRHWNRRPQHFAETLRRLDPTIWHVLAASYAAYRGIAVEDVLTFWWLAVTGTSQLPPRVHPLIEQADAAAESYASKL